VATAIDELRREIHKRGYDTERDGKGHYNIFKDGEIVRTKKGIPLEIPSTPSTHRGVNNAVARLRDAGVLPKPAEVKRRNGNGKVKLDRDRLKQYSDALRVEVQTLMRDHKLTQSDISHYADYYASQHGIAVPSFGQGVISKFLKGQYLSNPNYKWLSSAVSAIKANKGEIPKANETRGLMQKQADRAGEGIKVVTEDPTPTPLPPRLPKLAFDVMQLCYAEEHNDDAIRAIVEEVAKMELNIKED